MSVVDFLEPESAPLAGSWAEDVSLIKLDVLDRMAKSKFVNAHASCSVSGNLHDWHAVNEFFSVRSMGFQRELNT